MITNFRDVVAYKKHGRQPKDYYIAGIIRTQMIYAVRDAPAQQNKGLYIEQALELTFKNIDWANTFHTPHTIVIEETATSEHLMGMHNWLRRKCANIENITVVITGNTGVCDWWKSWCGVFREKSFRVIEWPFPYRTWNIDRGFAPSEIPTTIGPKNLQYMFSCYGGSYSIVDRCYLILKLCKFYSSSVIDYLGKFCTKQELLDYVEWKSYYSNQNEIDAIDNLYDQHIINQEYSKPSLPNLTIVKSKVNEAINWDGFQWAVDQKCFAAVVRETINDDVFPTVSEKTTRSFLHFCTVLPTGYNAVKDLETLGFWFPHDLIDYSYQSHASYIDRINGLCKNLEKLQTLLATGELQAYYDDNIEKYHHNALLVLDMYQDAEQQLNT